MNDAFFDFEWKVGPRYEWQDWLNDEGKPVTIPEEGLDSLETPSAVELVWNDYCKKEDELGRVTLPGPVLSFDYSRDVRHYYPMRREHAALFREFADLDYRNQPAILGFAERYGLLGVGVQDQSVRFLGDDGEWNQHYAIGEPYLRWAVEICFMREGLRAANRRHSRQSKARLLWLFNRNLQHVQGRLAFNEAEQPTVLLAPLTLISAMWLQLALAVAGEKEFVACKFCRRLFEKSTDQTGFRSHREFCSGACKTKDYRKRKRTALRLAKSGESQSAIAEKTGTDKATVRGWLRAAKNFRSKSTSSAKRSRSR